MPAPEAAWGYRTSRMMREGWVVLGATLQLRADSPAAIAARMEELRERRESKQPLEMPSAGSTFKRALRVTSRGRSSKRPAARAFASAARRCPRSTPASS